MPLGLKAPQKWHLPASKGMNAKLGSSPFSRQAERNYHFFQLKNSVFY